MSLVHSPSIVTNGLVFSYDQSSLRSYVGPAISNLANNISFSGIGTGTGYSSTGVVETVNIPQLGPTTVYTNNIQNNYTAYAPNSGNCCPSLHSWGGFTVSPSTLYTYGIVYRCDSGYTHPNYMYRYEYTSSGGSYVTESGVHSDANRVALGGGWFYAWGTFTTQPTTNYIGGAHTFYYRYFNLPDRLSVAKVLVAAGNWSGLHPKYWPTQATARPNTRAIVDLTGNNTITATSLTYAADGTFSFNGSSDYIFMNNNTALDTQTPTVDVWIKTNATTQNGFWFEKGSVNTQYALFQEGTQIQWRMGPLGDSISYATASSINTAGYFNVVATRESGNQRLYINGVNVASGTQTGTLSTNSYGMNIGRHSSGYYYNGRLPMVKVYNRALTAAEVQQNFNAHRGRYGI